MNIQDIQQWAAAPIGLGLGAYALARLIGLPRGSTRAALAVGLPYGFYRYWGLRSPESMLRDISDMNRAFYEKARDPSANLFVSPAQLETARQSEQQRIMQRFADPAGTAAQEALPAFAAGLALPSALALVSRIRK